LVDQSGTGFRRCKIGTGDLLVIDTDCNLVSDAPNGSLRKAPVNTAVHAEYYKTNPLARACIHSHAPYSQVFACLNLPITPFTLQSRIMGEVSCVFLEDDKLKKEFFEQNISLNVPTGLHSRSDVYYVMQQVAKKIAATLEPRNLEMEKHGLAATHYQHGIFVFGRNLNEAFDNLERIEANARAIILSKQLLK
jgi:ribulose-5-phosphate 4-epimerase/fuculose-1-phosphate aldolase